jgi:hypothetical protein
MAKVRSDSADIISNCKRNGDTMNVIAKIKKIADGLNGNFVSWSVADALELFDGVIAQATKVNPDTGKTLVYSGYVDGSIKSSVIVTKPSCTEYAGGLR